MIFDNKTILIILVVAVALILFGIIVSGYVKAPPNVAFIISGLGRKPKILIGRAGIKIPFLERKDALLIKQITVDIKTEGYVPTLDFIGVDIDAVAKVRVSTSTEDTNKGIFLAMKNFLNMDEEEIADALKESLQGNMREIIGTVSLKELCNDRKKFGDQVQEKAQTDMNVLGIEILSCNIQKISDERDLITALGMDNMSQIQKDASIAKANADKEVAIAEAEAKKAANDAQVAAETEIAIKRNEFAIRQAELKREADIKKAEADAAYQIQEEEQRKTIEVTRANADIAKQEREIELKQKEAKVAEQQLDAQVRKKADAEKYRRQQEAEANLIERQREAEAQKYEQEQRADAEKYQQEKKAEAIKAQADAAMYSKQKEAEGIASVGKAEAAAIEAKGIAEAEAMEKKAEAMKKYGQAAMMEMIVKALPEMAKAVAEPLSTIDKVTIIDSGNGDGGVGSMGNYVPSVLAKTIEAVKETTGLDITEIMKAETYDAKVTKNVNLTGMPDVIIKENNNGTSHISFDEN